MAPPPTAQTPGPNWLKFFVEAPQEDTFRGIGGIFEFRLRSWNIGAFVLILEPFGGSKNTLKWATKSSLSWLLGWNSKIPPMPLKVSSWGASTKKLSQFGPGVWAVGGVPSILAPPHLIIRALLYILYITILPPPLVRLQWPRTLPARPISLLFGTKLSEGDQSYQSKIFMVLVLWKYILDGHIMMEMAMYLWQMVG